MISKINLSAILFCIVTTFYVIDFIFMKKFDPERKTGGKGWSWDYTLFTILIGLIIILQPVLLPQIGFYTNQVWGLMLQSLGLIVVIASLGLHTVARQHLRKFYTERVEVQPDHQVIQTGPYAWIRHPIIASFFGLGIGIFLLAPSIITLSVSIYIFWDFTRAAQQEEAVLMERLPNYEKYMQNVPRFFPRLWRNRK